MLKKSVSGILVVRIAFLSVAFYLLSTLLFPHLLLSQGSGDLKRGVVKITAQAEGQQSKVGTDSSYVLTRTPPTLSRRRMWWKEIPSPP